MEYIHISTTDNVATLTLNRANKRNALNGPFIQELQQVLNELSKDAHLRVLLIQGAGEHFCAGADIEGMQKMANVSYSENEEDAQRLADLLYQLYTFPKPTIALVHGATLGGGLGLLSACDIAIATKSASFGFSEVKIGLIPAVISPYIVSAIGERAARYYFLTGERFSATEAHRLGLIQQISDDHALESVGMTLVKIILQNGPLALTALKQMLHKVTKEKITAELTQYTAEQLALIRSTPEAQEGLQAFLQKRSPKWEDN